MIIVRLRGGMGNQMFQYAFGRSLSVLKKTDLIIDKRYLEDRTPKKKFVFRNYDLDIFNINPVFKDTPKLRKYHIYITKLINVLFINTYKFLKLKLPKYYLEQSFNFDPEFTNLSNDVIADGYFQSFKYFENIQEMIINDFTFRYSISENCIDLLNKIKSTNSICINVRRGDFLSDELLGAKEHSYYNQGAKYLIEKLINPHLYIFSDDIEWCENNLKFDVPTMYVHHDYAGEKFRNYFELMINCKNFVIPNSSFGWWAAYLSPYKNKIVVSPKLWFTNSEINTDDLIPNNWIRI